MGWLSKKPAVVAEPAAPEPDPAPAPDLAGTPYVGDKKPCFRDGFYYLCDHDPDGNEIGPNTTVPLVWRDGGFHYARPEDPNHFHAHGLNALELEPGSE